jgi:hypothetical protein
MRPDITRVAPHFHVYIGHVKEDDLSDAFAKQRVEFNEFLKAIPAEKIDYRYAADKWTIREVLQHIIDAERVFAYRALRFARKDKTPLPGFDENLFAENSKADTRDWNSLIEEYNLVRKSNEYMFASFDQDQLDADGLAGNNANYVLALGYVMVGHALHHQKVTKERYL